MTEHTDEYVQKRCLHLWRSREGWFTPDKRTIFACQPCRRRWAALRFPPGMRSDGTTTC